MTRGARVIEDRRLVAREGQGRFVARQKIDLTGRPGTLAPEVDSARNWGTEILS